MARPAMIVPNGTATQPQGEVLIVYQIPDCRKDYSLNVYRISNTIERAKSAEPPSVDEYTEETVPMSVVCLFDPQPPYDGVASVIIDFTGADPGDYLCEIYDDDDNVFEGGTITIDAP